MSEKIQFYSGEELRKKKDLDGKKPKIFMSCGGRSTGKTVDWNTYLLTEFIEKGKQFILFYRFKYEIDNIAQRFFKSIDFKFPEGEMTDKNTNNLGFTYLYYKGVLCGFACAINSANSIKKYSSMFANVNHILFDEFIPEDNRYCPDEIKKFTSLFISIARGKGKAIRDDVDIIMIANVDTNDNLYFNHMNIKKTNEKTRFQRGNGWVCEFVKNERIIEQQKENPIIKIFDNGYITGEKTNDNMANIERIKNGKPVFDIELSGEVFGVWSADNNLFIIKKKTLKNIYRIRNDINSINPLNENVRTIIDGHFKNGTLKFENIHIKNLYDNN